MEVKQFVGDLTLEDKADDEGAVSCVFSTFGVVDKAGDITEPSFFTNGQEVVMSSWGHDWGHLPPGKGVIQVGENTAVFRGRFFMSTPQGQAHHNTIKEMGGLQKWSFGYRVLDAEYAEQDGEPVRHLKRGEIYEVSPVLVPANDATYTLDIKSLNNHMRLADQSEMALAAVQDLIARYGALAALREKDGRELSDTHRERLAKLLADLQTLQPAIEALLVNEVARSAAKEGHGERVDPVARSAADLEEEPEPEAGEAEVVQPEPEPPVVQVLTRAAQLSRRARALKLGLALP